MGSLSISVKCCVNCKFNIVFESFNWGIVIGFNGVILYFEVINWFEMVVLLYIYCRYIIVL